MGHVSHKISFRMPRMVIMMLPLMGFFGRFFFEIYLQFSSLVLVAPQICVLMLNNSVPSKAEAFHCVMIVNEIS